MLDIELPSSENHLDPSEKECFGVECFRPFLISCFLLLSYCCCRAAHRPLLIRSKKVTLLCSARPKFFVSHGGFGFGSCFLRVRLSSSSSSGVASLRLFVDFIIAIAFWSSSASRFRLARAFDRVVIMCLHIALERFFRFHCRRLPIFLVSCSPWAVASLSP